MFCCTGRLSHIVTLCRELPLSKGNHDKEWYEPNKLMSEKTELLSIDVSITDKYAKGTKL